jgi:hypothetical protein
MKRIIWIVISFSFLVNEVFGAEIRLIVNNGSAQTIFGQEINDKSLKKIARKREKNQLKMTRLGCDAEGSLGENFRINANICFGKNRNCGYNEVVELNQYLEKFMNYEVIYVNCSSEFLSERIPMGEATLTWKEAIDKAYELKDNMNLDYIFLVHIVGQHKRMQPDLNLELIDENKYQANCDGCSGEGKYHWIVDNGKEKRTDIDFFASYKSFTQLECFWRSELGDCESNVSEINSSDTPISINCDIVNPNPSINLSNDYVIYDKDEKSWVLLESNHTNYYLLLDSICNVESISITINDLNGKKINDEIWKAVELENQQSSRIMNKTEGSAKTELQVIEENPESFLIVIPPKIFKDRFHEIFTITVEYLLTDGRVVKLGSKNIRFNPCSE